MRRFVFSALLAASLSANAAMVAVAVWHHRPVPSGEPLLFSRVTLDADQRARISELRSRLVSTRESHGRRIAALRQQLAGVVMRQPADPIAVDRILGAIADDQAAYQRAVVEHVLAVRDVLRPEQRPAFEKMVGEQMSLGGTPPCGACAMPPAE